MPILREYHRPATLAEAVDLLAARGGAAALLAGGSSLLGELERGLRPEIDCVIDLSSLGLGGLRAGETHLLIGATATLTDVIEDSTAAGLADGLFLRAARAEGPVNHRNAATVGGLVAAPDVDSLFYTALLALGAMVTNTTPHNPVPLDRLAPPLGIITGVQVPLEPVRAGVALVARTPADRPIVAAVAVRGALGLRVAFCGLAARPLLEGATYEPYADFRGSVAYRTAMAAVLRARAVQATQ